MAPVIKALRAQSDLDVGVCVTAQHRQMLDQVMTLFNIVPDYDLDLMRPSQSLTDITTGVLMGIGRGLDDWKPDMVLVHGDTTTTFATSLAAFYRHIPVGHVEAGLRTGNIYAPWPEEMNRRLTTCIAELNFAPTDRARRHLLAAGVADSAIHVTGNTVIDALLEVVKRIDANPEIQRDLEREFSFLDFDRRLILVTGHRRESFGEGFRNICQALKQIVERSPGIQIVYPVHLNPNVQQPVTAILGSVHGIHLIEPVNYLPFVYLMRRACLIITDSGGIQEEAPSLGKPVLVMRETTERPEAIEAGTAELVGTQTATIVAAALSILEKLSFGEWRTSGQCNPYGDGKAAERIAQLVLQH